MESSGLINTKQLPLPVSIPKDQSIVKILESFSEHLETEILGRAVWVDNRLKITSLEIVELACKNLKRTAENKPRKEHFTIYIRPNDDMSCALTHTGLMSAFFGKNFDDSVPFIGRQNEDPSLAVDKVKQMMLAKEAPFSLKNRLYHAFFGYHSDQKILDENNWTIYSVQLLQRDVGYLHSFIILQLIENNKVVYKILQSFVNEYRFIMKDTKTYTRADIFLMFDELLDFVKTTEWNEKYVHLISHFFHSKSSRPVGEKIDIQRRLILRCGDSTRASVEQFADSFVSDFPTDLKIKVLKEEGKR